MSDIDARLGRLRPTTSPDPEGFGRAHAALLAACTPDTVEARSEAPATLGHPDLLHFVERIDVVVPTPSVVRRRRRIAWAAATSAVVVAGVALWPHVPPFDPAAASDRCERWVADHAADLDDTHLVAVLAVEQDGVENVMLAGTSPEGALVVSACSFDGTEDHPGPYGYGSPGWLTARRGPEALAADDVVGLGTFWSAAPEGGRRGGASFVAGCAGVDVVAVTLHFARGEPVEAVVDDGYWGAWYLDPEAGGRRVVDLTWTLQDGTSRGPTPFFDIED